MKYSPDLFSRKRQINNSKNAVSSYLLKIYIIAGKQIIILHEELLKYYRNQYSNASKIINLPQQRHVIILSFNWVYVGFNFTLF